MMPETLKQLAKEHENMARLLDILEHQLELFAAQEQPDYDILEALVAYFRAFPDRLHHPKEEMILERLAQCDPEAAKQVFNLTEEHEQLEKETAHFALAVESLQKDAEMPRENFLRAAREFVAHQRAHMREEGKTFFPLVLDRLGEEDWQAIDQRVDDPEDPVFGAGAAEEFEELRHAVEEWDKEDRCTESRA